MVENTSKTVEHGGTLYDGANALQIGGDHYKTDYQHWDVLIALGFNSEYYIGQATKYITRWRKKNGIRDLKKGQHFVAKLIELVEKHHRSFLLYGMRKDWEIDNLVVQHRDHLRQYFTSNDIGPDEQGIFICIVFANGTERLRMAYDEIDVLIAKAVAEEEASLFKDDAETPVSQGFEFIEYTDHDTVRWRKKDTGEVQDLPLTTPPVFATWK